MDKSDMLLVETIKFVPFRPGNILKPFAASFQITDPDLKISAASAFYPTMAGISQNVFEPSIFTERKSLDKTAIIKGFTDLGNRDIDLFVTYSGEEHKAEMREKLSDYRCIPLFSDPLAILANKENPVTDLSLEQVKDIYSGKLTNWQEVGGEDNPIVTYQLSRGNNVSRLAFDNGIMDAPPVRLPDSDIETMPALVNNVGDDKNAIGNIFWSYYARMYATRQTRYISVDGKHPESPDYPLVFPVYLHYDAANTKKQLHELIEYLMSEEGKRLTAQSYQRERVVQ